MTVGGSGYVYVADEYSHRVQVFNPGGTRILTLGDEGTGHGRPSFRAA